MDSVSVARLEASASVEEVMQRLDDLVRPYGADISSIRLYCHEHDRASVLCSVNATANAPAIAAAIGGRVFGFSLACRNVHPVRSDFRCPNRQKGIFLMPACSQCGRDYSLKRADAGDGLLQPPPDGCLVAPQPDRRLALEAVDDAL